MSAASDWKGRIGRTLADSEPWWPEPVRPPAGAPDVVVIVLDDTGFAHFGCYGSTIETPNIDRLAANGLRFANFHTTALCSPTRAALLTGRNHHTVGMRGLSNWNTGFPNCTGRITKQAATLAEVLRDAGYATFATGKWHLTPMSDTSAAGPYDQWPLGRGFDRFYGFMQGETDQFFPELYRDNQPVGRPVPHGQRYHVSEDIVDESQRYVRELVSAVPEKPFFLYLAFGATHAPHQAPPEYLAKYRGCFDRGWDAVRDEWFARQKSLGVVPANTNLPPRNPGVRPWADLSADEKRLALRLQEAFAAFLDHTDTQIGRLVQFLAGIGRLENTLLLVMSDNGASQEGGPIGVLDTMRSFNGVPERLDEAVRRLDDIGGPNSNANYPWGWAQAGNTPLKRYKQNTHGGGIRDPLVVHWPARLRDGGAIRRQFHHVSDVMPTVLELVGVSAPEVYRGVPQLPISGTSMAYALDPANADAPTRKDTQLFEMLGHRGIWHRGWKAVAHHERGKSFDDDVWELYHLADDFSECHDLAAKDPDKLRELVDLWWAEAGRVGALPLDERSGELFGGTPPPGSPRARRRWVYYPPVAHVNSDVAPAIGSRSFTIEAEVEAERPDGVIVATGSCHSGLALYVRDGTLRFDYNLFGHHFRAVSRGRVPAGRANLGVVFTRIDRNATAKVVVNGEEGAEVAIPFVMRMISSNGMDLGHNPGSAVSDDYAAPFPFAGRIERVTFATARRVVAAHERDAQRAEQRTEMGRE